MDEVSASSINDQMDLALSELPEHLQAIAEKLPDPLLHAACAAGELELVRGLIAAGLDPGMYPHTEDGDDYPPLTWIANHRDQTSPKALLVAQFLIESGSDVDEGEPLLAALEQEDITLALMLLAAGADTKIDFGRGGASEAALLAALLETGWVGIVGPDPVYYISVDATGAVSEVGLGEHEVLGAANGAALKVVRVPEQFVARYLLGAVSAWPAS